MPLFKWRQVVTGCSWRCLQARSARLCMQVLQPADSAGVCALLFQGISQVPGRVAAGAPAHAAASRQKSLQKVRAFTCTSKQHLLSVQVLWAADGRSTSAPGVRGWVFRMEPGPFQPLTGQHNQVMNCAASALIA